MNKKKKLEIEVDKEHNGLQEDETREEYDGGGCR